MPRIAILPGDGIGPEITAEVIKILEVLRSGGASLEWRIFDYSADSYLKTGKAMPDGAFEELSSFDAIFLGAFGDPRVPDSAHARDILLGLRFGLDLYVNLRPAKLMLDSLTPLKGMAPGDIDLVVVRENTEGAYVGAGGFLRRNTPEEIAVQEPWRTSTMRSDSSRTSGTGFSNRYRPIIPTWRPAISLSTTSAISSFAIHPSSTWS